MTAHNKSIAKVAFVMLIWAGSFSVTKAGIEQHIPPMYFAFLRFALASLILLPILYVKKKRRKEKSSFVWTRSEWYKVIWMSITGITLYYAFFNLALVYTSASMGSLIQGFIPVGVVIIAAVFLKERLQLIQMGGIIISILGVICIGFISDPETSDSMKSLVLGMSTSTLGNILVLVSALCWVVYTVISKKLSHLDSTELTTCSTVIGTLLFVPFVIMEFWNQPIPFISWQGWIELLYLGILASALSYFWYNDAMKQLNAVQVGIFNNLDPVMGAVIAVIFLQEPISSWQIAGTLFVLAGVWISTIPLKQQNTI